jgi:Bacterial SH3 domain
MKGVLAGVAALVALGGSGFAQDAESRFQAANEAARAGDLPRAIEGYRELATGGDESASLYWNWAQVAAQRGTLGEGLWALLRGRAVEPHDSRLGQEIDRLREAASLDPAEISPEPLAGIARVGRRMRLGWIALLAALASVVCHAVARRTRAGWAKPAAWTVSALTVVVAAVPLVGALARPTAVVARPDAPLLESASSTASSVGELREGEVVPILAESAGYLRVEDSSGARGWAREADVWSLDRPPGNVPGE